MRRVHRQDGSTLMLLVGVVAALAILASSMVVLLSNVRSNTARDRSRGESFNVAEAGIDLAQATLWQDWPAAEANAQPDLTEADLASEYITSQELTGLDLTVRVWDDDDPSRSWDGPGVDTAGNPTAANNFVYVESTATVNDVTTQIQVKVERIPLNLRVKENTALYTESEINISGTGSNNPIGADPPATAATTYANGVNINGNAGFPAAGFPLVDPDDESLTVNDVFPDEIVGMLVEEAQQTGRYFANEDTIDWDLVTVPEGEGSYPHLVVVEQGNLHLQDNDCPASLWTQEHPGIIILLDSSPGNGSIVFNGHQEIYGIIYCENAFTGAGTPDIHGMVVAKGEVELKGDRAIKYNPNVINNLNRMVAQTVRVVKNTWREVSTGSID